MGDLAGGAAPPDTGKSIHTLTVPQVFDALHTQPAGLAPAEASARLANHGPNAILRVHGQPLWSRFLSNFTHLMALLLWAGGAIAFAARMPQLGIAVWLVNLINGAFSFWQEFRAEKATEALRAVLPQRARVLRAGTETTVPAEELVPGDVLVLSEGDRISADARLVEEWELRVDQSTLSGEAHAVRKTRDAVPDGPATRAETQNLVFAGTNVASGTGRGVVLATGMATEFGKIAHLTQSLGEEQSPLQKEMAHTTRLLTGVAVGMGLFFFLLSSLFAGIHLAEALVFALGMVVAFVPEGLLPTVTLTLAMGVQRMARRNALVKKLSAVETLGCTSVICTDKTGTLTQNEMTVRALWLDGRSLTLSGAGYAPLGQVSEGERPVSALTDGRLRALLTAGALCSNAKLAPPGPGATQWTVLGDPTEAALLVAARKAGLDVEEELRRMPRLREIPFDSRRRRMTTLHPAPRATPGDPFGFHPGHDAAVWVACVKGAPREVLGLCSQRLRGDGIEPLTAEALAGAEEATDRFAREGLRVLAVAARVLPALAAEGRAPLPPEEVERDLTLLGLVAMMDPPRAEVAAAVAKCRTAGIRIIMITGDYGLTAESIARRVGIVTGRQVRLVSGTELDTLDAAGLEEALRGEVVFARAAPEQKLRVVEALQRLGHVVAVTGDGVNDAPALRKADIGVAMGLSGTDVAREAADVVLADDNFASIVSAVEEGRAVYSNLKKFITYVLTSNTPEAVPFVVFALSGGRIPLGLTVMQVLAIDLGTDLVPALALGAEPPEPGVMDKPPRNLKEHAITRPLLVRAYLWLGVLQSVAAMAAFTFHYWTHGYAGQWLGLPAEGPVYRGATTMALGAVVATQVGNLFAQRTTLASLRQVGFFGNRLLWVGVGTECALFAALVYAPPLQWVFGTGPLPLQSWAFLAAWAPLLLVADEMRKAWLRRRAKISGGAR